MNRLYSLAETAEASGANAQTLRNWVTTGRITPARPGTTGTGNSHRFTAVQVLAVTAAVRYREAGAAPDRALGVMAFLAGLSRERLEEDLRAGRTFIVPASVIRGAAAGKGSTPGLLLPGGLITPPDDSGPNPAARALAGRLDVGAMWQSVKQKLDELRGRRGPARKASQTTE